MSNRVRPRRERVPRTVRKDPALMQDILSESEMLASFIKRKNFTDFVADPLLQRGIARSVEIISEAVRRLSPSAKEKIGDIEWDVFVFVRDKIAHEYWEIDHVTVWEFVKGEDIQAIISAVKVAIENP